MARIVNKIFAAIVMGHVGWFCVGVPITLVVVPLTADPHPWVGWAFVGPAIAVVATIAVTVFAPTGRIAWGRLCLINGVASLGLPLAGIVFSMLLGHQADAATAGTKISVSGTLWFVGLSLGAVFVTLGLAILRNAARPSSPTEG